MNVLSQPQLQLDVSSQILQETGTAVSACHAHRCQLDCWVEASAPSEITPYLLGKKKQKKTTPPEELRQGTGRRFSARISQIWAGCLAHCRV